MNLKKLLWGGIFLLGSFGILGTLAYHSSEELTSPLPPMPTEFTLVVLPDTQYYVYGYPEIFESQTRFIVDQQEARNIVFVSHTGDIVDSWDKELEWQRAGQAISLLDGVVPYGLLPGNHDDRQSFNRFFPVSRYQNEPWYGGHFGDSNNNSYQFFSVGNLDFIIFHLEFKPGEAVIDWADQVLERNPDHRAIIATHYFLDYDGFRNPASQKIFEALSDNPNLFLILCGHIHTESRRTDVINGRPIHQLLADYQERENGGDGWLRILKFIPEEDKIDVFTYSPWLGEFETDANSQFELDYQM